MSSLEELVKVLCDTQTSKNVYEEAIKSYKKLLVENIKQENDFIMVITTWQNKNFEKFLGILREICLKELPKNTSVIFFLNIVIPTIMDVNTNDDIRDMVIDIAFMLIKILPILSIPKDEVNAFLTIVSTRYIEAVGQLRERNYVNWHRLWIFLVRFCGKHIHHSTELTNKLLRVVEVAFRNSSNQQRISGYDCWKEIIDNAALDMNYICSPKQIKLLVTPLKAKFSKQESVICKRFEVFAYLLKKLQYKAVLCLPEFLEFCFGPLESNKDSSKSGQGKNIPQLWGKSAQILLEIIGHSHSKSIDCIAVEVIKFDTPIITHLNFQTFYKIIIRSVGESCILLRNVSADVQKEKAIKCMWKSIFNLIMPALEDHKLKYFESVSSVLNIFIELLPDNQYFEDLILLILTVLIAYDVDFSQEAFQNCPELLRVLFKLNNIDPHIVDYFKQIISHSFTKITLVEDKLRLITKIMENVVYTNRTAYNVMTLSKIWLCLAEELVLDLTVEQIENFSAYKIFFLWPIHNLSELDDHMKKQILFCWMKFYKKMNGDDESKKMQLMKKLEILFKSNPLLSYNIVSIMAVMSQFETKFAKDFVEQLLEITAQILQLPTLKSEEEQKIIIILNPFFDSSLELYQLNDNNEIISRLCNCIKHFLSIHKCYKILETLTLFLKSSTEQLRETFFSNLSDTLLNLSERENDSKSYAAKELQKILAVLNTQTQEEKEKEKDKKTFIVPTGRSARIANLVRNSPKSPQKRSKKTTSPSPLRLFGKDLDTLSPLKVKGSQLNNSPKTTPKKVVNILNHVIIKDSKSLNEENSSDFVPINSEVKFNPKKLNEHQKEVMKQRRDNIPALYEDLSQSSQSQSLFSSKSNSNSNSIDVLENKEKDKKCFIEYVEHSEMEHANFPTKFVEDEQKLEVEHTDFSIKCTEEKKIETENIFSSESDMFKTQSGKSEDIFGTPNLISSSDRIPILRDSFKVSKCPTPQTPIKRKRKTSNKTPLKKDSSKISESPAPKTPTRRKRKSSTKTDKTPLSEDSFKITESPAPKSSIRRKRKSKIATSEENNSELSESPTRKTPTNRKRKPMELELNRLRMNIVGANSFTLTARRTRPKELKKEEEKKTKNKTVKNNKNDKNQEITDNEKSPKKRGRKRKIISVDENDKNEDIIESSQESFTDITSLLNSSKKKSKMDSSEETSLEQKMITVVHKDVQENVEQGSEVVKEEISTIISENSLNITATEEYKLSENNSIHLKQDINSESIANQDFSINSLKDEGEISKDEDNEVVQNISNIPQESIENADTSQNTTNSSDIIQTQDTTHSQDTTQTQDTTQSRDITQIEDSSLNTTEHLTESQDTQSITNKVEVITQETAEFCSESQYEKVPVLYLNLPKKPELTESEEFQCKMDTMSLDTNIQMLYNQQCSEEVKFRAVTPIKEVESEQINEAAIPVKEVECEQINEAQTPVKEVEDADMLDLFATPSTSSIPSSPITSETPKRTSELLNSTLDISPINSKNSSSTESVQSIDIPIQKNLVVQDELTEESDVFEVVKNLMSDVDAAQKIEIIEEDVIQNVDNVLEEMNNDPVRYESPSSSEDDSNQDENVLVEIEGDQNAEIIEEIVAMGDHYAYNIEDIPESGDNISSNTETVEVPDQNVFDNGSKTSSLQERSTKLLSMLTVNSPRSFNKRRSSNSGMSPSTGRIRRLMLSIKQKPNTDHEEINEEDILTFKREIPSPLARPRNSILKRKLSDIGDEGISPCPKRKRVNFSDPCLTSKKIFIKDDFPSSCEAKRLFDNYVEQKEDGLKAIFDLPDDQGSTESENIETEPSLEIIHPFMLRKDRPIYPKLVDCQDDVIVIVKKVTSPLFLDILMKKLQSKKIKTVGDLAYMCEVEINRLPFKVPVVANVLKALDNYYKKKGGKEESEHIKANGLVEETKDVYTEMEQVLNRAKQEHIPIEDLATKVLSNLDSSQIFNIFKTYKFPIKDLLLNHNVNDIMKYLLDKFSISNIFNEVKELVEPHNFSATIVELSSNESLTDILRNYTIDDVRKVLTEENVFETKLILDKCLLPLIRTPEDISGYLLTLTTVELGNIVIKRLESEDLDTFLNNLSKNLPSGSDTLAVRTIIGTLKNDDDIFDTFKCCIERQSEESRKNIMLKMFRFIGDNLNVNTCLNLHVELLNKISNTLIVKDSGSGSGSSK